ncbi:MAG: metallophosphoesterase [Candidatus Pacearchaeota archaeon]
MDTKEISNFFIRKGILLDNEILDLFTVLKDQDSIKFILEKITEKTNQKIITREIFFKNRETIRNLLSELPNENKEKIEQLKIKLGLRIEISRSEKIVSKEPGESKIEEGQKEIDDSNSGVKVFSLPTMLNNKIVVKDFVTHFSNRFLDTRDFLKESPKLKNLVSINKLSYSRQNVSIIGMIYSKQTTKNNNLILEVEDLTGSIRVLINQNKPELYKEACEISLDSIVGFKGSGNNEVLFANELVFPEARNPERKKSPMDESAVFISDLHIGSKLFLEKNFLRFIDYLNGKLPNTSDFSKVKYVFVIGDIVAGVGVYPNQEKDLEVKDIEGQYSKAAEIFGKIRKDITLIMIPGNHDCVRLMEPQPVLDEKYAWPLYGLENAVFATNPSTINVGSTKEFSGFDVLAYHGFSYPYYANTIPSLISKDAINDPIKIMEYLLKNRHLAPAHASVQYSPAEKDTLLIRKAPDIFVSGHMHKSGISYFNNVLVVSNSCWEDLTPFQEKMGNKPDFCKVPMFNFKTRQVKILDFYDGDKGEEK